MGNRPPQCICWLKSHPLGPALQQKTIHVGIYLWVYPSGTSPGRKCLRASTFFLPTGTSHHPSLCLGWSWQRATSGTGHYIPRRSPAHPEYQAVACFSEPSALSLLPETLSISTTKPFQVRKDSLGRKRSHRWMPIQSNYPHVSPQRHQTNTHRYHISE